MLRNRVAASIAVALSVSLFVSFGAFAGSSAGSKIDLQSRVSFLEQAVDFLLDKYDAGPGNCGLRVEVTSADDSGYVGTKIAALDRAGGPNPDYPGSVLTTVSGAVVSVGDACSTVSGDGTGKIALVERGTCLFETKVVNAQAANYAAVIVYSNAGDDLVSMGGIDANAIPSVFIGETDGETMMSNTGVVVDIPPSPFCVEPKM